MSGNKLAALRSPSGDDDDDGGKPEVVLDLPRSSKFGITWSSGAIGPPCSSGNGSILSAQGEANQDRGISSGASLPSSKDTSDGNFHSALKPASQQTSGLPLFSRSSSMPLPSQLGHLRNPCRSPSSTWNLDAASAVGQDIARSQLREVSLELADSVQTVVQTLLRVSPPQLLDPVKEQFSACSLCIPTPSISALLTSMKNLNYISAHMDMLCSETSETPLPGGSGPALLLPSARHNDFDIGEMLQSVGDVLSGAAAQVGVDLVLYHGDLGMKHVSVRGDEGGISFALSHVCRQVISTARHGDTLEIGLFVAHGSSPAHSSSAVDRNSPPIPSLVDPDEPLHCSFVIGHKLASLESPVEDSESFIRPPPDFSTLLLRRLLRKIGASLTPNLEPNLPSRRSYELTVTLKRGSPSNAKTPIPNGPNGGPDYEEFGDFLVNEPSLQDLNQFAEKLRGRKVTLYASSKGSFAHHLTGYLTSWGLDVSHVSSDAGPDADAPSDGSQLPETNFSPDLSMTSQSSKESSPSAKDGSASPLSFVLIDDDVNVLRDRLHEFRVEHTQHRVRKRPSLSIHQRPQPSTQTSRNPSQIRHSSLPSPVVIMHFTSLANYKLVKDLVQSILTSDPSGTMPEVMIIPKPAGPRRFLTALHTAVTKPLVDPSFIPTATSPSSRVHTENPFYSSMPKPSTPRPTAPQSDSDRSTSSPKEPYTEAPSSIPPSSDGREYFSETKLGSSPSSGLVIQSPDGQPAGIFFHPKAKSAKVPSKSLSIERDRRKSSEISKQSAEPGTISFSALGSPSGSSRSKKSNTAKPTSPQQEISSSSISQSSVAAPPREIKIESIAQQKSASEETPLKGGATPSSSQRPATKRGYRESKTTSSPRKGKSPADANVVPPINVLIVDDNPITQTILSTWMKKKQIKYDVAMNGLEAVQKWKTGGFHLILMDIQMPVMDGIQATKEIRRLEKINAAAGYPPSTPSEGGTPRTPSDATYDSRPGTSPYRSSVIIVALTASSLQSDRVAALAAGCNDFLTKPVSLVWLNSKIIEWGSIKALQMWADLRPEVVKSISTKQDAQAWTVAQRLHVPQGRSPSRSRSNSVSRINNSTTAKENSDAVVNVVANAKGILALPGAGASSSIQKAVDAPITEGDSSQGQGEGWLSLITSDSNTGMGFSSGSGTVISHQSSEDSVSTPKATHTDSGESDPISTSRSQGQAGVPSQ